MKTILKTILVFVLVSTMGCTQNETIPIDESNKLIGHWINPVYKETNIQLTRASSLKSDAYGMSFLAESQCVERSSGWCGTPPLTFSDFEGSWTRTDSVLIVTITGQRWPVSVPPRREVVNPVRPGREQR